VQSEAKIDIEKPFIYFFLLSGDVFCSVLFLQGHLRYVARSFKTYFDFPSTVPVPLLSV